jgi:hypothetical protein
MGEFEPIPVTGTVFVILHMVLKESPDNEFPMSGCPRSYFYAAYMLAWCYGVFDLPRINELHQAYTKSGADLSQFDSSCDCGCHRLCHSAVCDLCLTLIQATNRWHCQWCYSLCSGGWIAFSDKFPVLYRIEAVEAIVALVEWRLSMCVSSKPY